MKMDDLHPSDFREMRLSQKRTLTLHILQKWALTSMPLQRNLYFLARGLAVPNSSNNENTAFWLSVRKKRCFEKGIAKEIETYESTQLNTLLERLYAEIKKWFGHRQNNSLTCLARLWTFLRLKDVKISLYITVLIVRGCFDRMHNFEWITFALDVRALLLHNYDKLFRIF